MKKALTLVAYPKIPRTIPRDGMQLSARRHQGQYTSDVSLARMPILGLGMVGGYRDKAAVLKVGGPTLGECPNSPSIVLKERLHTIIRQSIIGYLAHIEFSFLLAAAAPARCASLTVNR